MSHLKHIYTVLNVASQTVCRLASTRSRDVHKAMAKAFKATAFKATAFKAKAPGIQPVSTLTSTISKKSFSYQKLTSKS